MPFFSVIIPTFNRVNEVQNAIDSVLNQSYKDFEIMVVDDASQDNSFDVLSFKYKNRIKIYKINKTGVSGARNFGIKKSNSEWVAFLDSDDVWLPNKLEKQFNYIVSNKDILIHQTDEIWIRNGKRVNPMKKHLKKEGDIFEDSLKLCMITPSSVVINNRIFDDVGLFDEKLPACEDYDLWLRISYKYHIGLINEKLIIKYGGHNDQLSKQFWGMDRFRVYSICKLINSVYQKDNYRYDSKKINSAKKVLLQKCNILVNGAKKRGNEKLLKCIESIIDWNKSVETEFNNYRAYNNKVFDCLLKL